MTLGWIIYYFGQFLLGLVLAPVIYRDAVALQDLFLGTSPLFWAISCVVLGPLWTMLIYWLIHYSNISGRSSR